MEYGLYSIQLNTHEAALADAIKFDPHETLGNTRAFHANGDLVVQLLDSLLARKAIPDQRLRYFSDPEYNVGGRGSSRQQQFMRNAGSREGMVRHGHFLQYLRYFIHGANLPSVISSSFAQAVEDCGMVTSGDIAPLSAKARQLVRTHCPNPKTAADEFYKLCLDLGLSGDDATLIRSSVLQVKKAP